MKSFDVVMPKPDPRNSERRVWVKLGVAFLDENSGSGMLELKLDSMPVRDDGVVFFPSRLCVFMKRPHKVTKEEG